MLGLLVFSFAFLIMLCEFSRFRSCREGGGTEHVHRMVVWQAGHMGTGVGGANSGYTAKIGGHTPRARRMADQVGNMFLVNRVVFLVLFLCGWPEQGKLRY